MPAWNLGDLMSYATRRMARSDIAQSDASFWVNEAYAEVAQAAPHALLEKSKYYSVSSGDSLLTLPADFLEPVDLSHDTTEGGSSKTLDPTSASWADAQGYYPVAKPKKYFIYGDNIQLWPSADSSINSDHASSARSYRLRYRAQAEEMVSTSSVPSLETPWRRAILHRAESHLHELVGNEQEAAGALAKYFSYTQSLKDARARRKSGQGRQAMSLPMKKRRYS